MGGHVVYWDECCSEVKKIAALFNNFCAFINGSVCSYIHLVDISDLFHCL